MLEWHPIFFSEFQRLAGRLTYPRRYATGAVKDKGRWITFSDAPEFPLQVSVFCRICGWIQKKVKIPHLRYRYNSGQKEGQVCVVVEGLPEGDKCPGGCGNESSRVLDSILNRQALKRAFSALVTELSRLYYGAKESKENKENKACLPRTPSHPNLHLAPIQEHIQQRTSSSLPNRAARMSPAKRRATLSHSVLKRSGSDMDLRRKRRESVGGDDPRKIKWHLCFENASGVRTQFLPGIYCKERPLYHGDKSAEKETRKSKESVSKTPELGASPGGMEIAQRVLPKFPSNVTLRSRASFLQYRNPPPVAVTPLFGAESPRSINESLLLSSPTSSIEEEDQEFWLVDSRSKKSKCCRRRWKSASEAGNTDGTLYKTAIGLDMSASDEEEERSVSPKKEVRFELAEELPAEDGLQPALYKEAAPSSEECNSGKEVPDGNNNSPVVLHSPVNSNAISASTAGSGSECDSESPRRNLALLEEEPEDKDIVSEMDQLFRSARRGLRGEQEDENDLVLANAVISYCMMVTSVVIVIAGKGMLELALEYFW